MISCLFLDDFSTDFERIKKIFNDFNCMKAVSSSDFRSEHPFDLVYTRNFSEKLWTSK